MTYNIYHCKVCNEKTTDAIAECRKCELAKEILKYCINDIHESCNTLGHATNWEYFETELKTYLKIDMVNLLKELEENYYTIKELKGGIK